MNLPHLTELEKELYSLGGRNRDDLKWDGEKQYVIMADGNGGLYKYYL